MMIRILRAAAASLPLCVFAAPAPAQTYPDRPVKIIVGTAPGGGFDLTARLLAQELGERLKGSFIVNNIAGAGGLIGTRAALKPSDGYTLIIGGLSNLVWHKGVYLNPGYDAATDFTPIGIIWGNPYVLVARKDLPASTISEVTAAAKAAPGKMTVGSAGPGTGQDVMALIYAHLAGVEFNKINYRGASPVYTDMIGGRIDIFFDSLTTAVPQIEGGTVKVIATNGAQRNPRLPNTPTTTEAGIPGLTLERSSWFGLFAPAGTPAPVLEALRGAVRDAALSPVFQERFRAMGGEPFYVSAEDAGALILRETEKWIPLMRQAGIQPE